MTNIPGGPYSPGFNFAYEQGSGPPYPVPPAPGSNGIGLFSIGISPVGTIPPFDWWATVLSQYANSVTLTSILKNFFECIDQTANFDAFFDNIFNIDTAVGYGLDVWGRILNVSRTLHIPGTFYFGFNEASSGDEVLGFNQGPFYGGEASTQNYNLEDQPFRLLLLAKAASNISDGSIKSINAILSSIFPGRGNAYVIDNNDMSMVYNFTFSLSTVELAIVQQSGVLPTPTGVSATVVSA